MEGNTAQSALQAAGLPLLLTTREVAAALGITTREVHRMVNEGTLRHVRGFRKPMKFYREEIERWLNGEGVKR